MHQIIRLIAFLVVLTLFIFPPGSSAHAQERTIKSKYEFSTPELNAAQKLYSGKKYAEALSAFEAIIEKAKASQNYEEQIFAMEKRALALRRLNRYDDAIETMDQAIQLALDKLPKGHFLVSRMYYTRGTTDHNLRNFYNARAFLDTAVVYYRGANTYDSATYYRMVEYKYYAYQYSEGSSDTLLKYLDKLKQLEEIRQNKLYKPDVILNILQGYPTIYIQKGDFQQALAHAIRGYKYAIENREKVSNRYLAEAQYYLAQVLYFKKEFVLARDVGLLAMPIVESTPKNLMPEYYAFNNLLGAIYMALNEYEEALPYFQKAASEPLSRGGSSKNRDREIFRSQVIMNLGICYTNLNKNILAKEYFQRSLELRKDYISIPNSGFHDIYEFFGDFYSRNGDWANAMISYDSALRNGLSSYNGPLLKFPNDDKQDYSYADLRALSKKTNSLKEVAESQREPKDFLLSAQKYVQKTHDLLMRSRGDFAASEGKLFLSENFKGLYETGLDACYQLYSSTGDLKFFEWATLFAKQSKGILFLEQSQEFSLVNSELLSQDLKELFFESKRDLENLQKSFEKLINTSFTSDSVISLNEELILARQRNEKVKDSITNVLSEYSLDETISARILKERATLEIPEDQLLIEYFYGQDNIYVLGKSSESVSFQRIDRNESFDKSLRGLIDIVSRPPVVSEIENDFSSFTKYSSYLYKKLVEPTLDILGTQPKHLIIVPDEFLSRLPFETLVKGETTKSNGFNELNYLTRSFSIQYELSSELFSNEHNKIKARKRLLGIGFKQSLESDYGSLPGTDREIEYLQSEVEGTYMIEKSGNKKDFLNAARDYDILHLAVHGEADSTNRYESNLIFNGAGDNVLNTNDLYLAGLNARLTVLSACESGIGPVNRGEGTFSVARGFALVGVPSVVMSLWKVNDKITSGLMVDMYKNFVEEGKPINQALRYSKLKYLDGSDEYSAHPYYWAPFLQLGQNIAYNERNIGNQETIFYIIGGLALMSLLIFLGKRKRAI